MPANLVMTVGSRDGHSGLTFDTEKCVVEDWVLNPQCSLDYIPLPMDNNLHKYAPISIPFLTGTNQFCYFHQGLRVSRAPPFSAGQGKLKDRKNERGWDGTENKNFSFFSAAFPPLLLPVPLLPSAPQANTYQSKPETWEPAEPTNQN